MRCEEEVFEDVCNDCRDTRCACCGGPLEPDDGYVEVGVFRLFSGKLMAGDPGQFYKERFPRIELPPGDYCIETVEVAGFTARLRVSSDADGVVGARIAEARIRTGEFGVADAEHPRALTCIVESGLGDGVYDIREILRDGERVGFEVVFFGTGDESA